MGKPNDPVRGTLDVLILKTIALEPKQGWPIAMRIPQISREVLQVQQGSLYPPCTGWSNAAGSRPSGRKTETGRRARCHSLTASGRAQVEQEAAKLEPPLRRNQFGRVETT